MNNVPLSYPILWPGPAGVKRAGETRRRPLLSGIAGAIRSSAPLDSAGRRTFADCSGPEALTRSNPAIVNRPDYRQFSYLGLSVVPRTLQQASVAVGKVLVKMVLPAMALALTSILTASQGMLISLLRPTGKEPLCRV